MTKPPKGMKSCIALENLHGPRIMYPLVLYGKGGEEALEIEKSNVGGTAMGMLGFWGFLCLVLYEIIFEPFFEHAW